MRFGYHLLLIPVAVVSLWAQFASTAEPVRKDPPHESAKAGPSIFVSAAQVLCLAQKGLQPTGKPVAAKGKRPAGVAVYGVSGLGIGARDGDVVTEILGQPVRSVPQGVAMIVAARAARRPVITGTIWRRACPLAVTVEQPYDVTNCNADEADCWKSHCVDRGKPKAKARRDKPATADAK